MATINQISVDGTVYDLPGAGTAAMLDAILASREIVWSDDASAWQYRGHNIFTTDTEKAVKEEGYANALIFYSLFFKNIGDLENGFNFAREMPFFVIPMPINIPLNTEPRVSIADMLESNQYVKIVFVGLLYLNNAYEAFGGASALEEIDGVLDVSPITNAEDLEEMFFACDSLRTVSLHGLSCNLNLANCTNLSEASLKEMIDYANEQPDGFTIVLPDGYPVSYSTRAAATAKKIALV